MATLVVFIKYYYYIIYKVALFITLNYINRKCSFSFAQAVDWQNIYLWNCHHFAFSLVIPNVGVHNYVGLWNFLITSMHVHNVFLTMYAFLNANYEACIETFKHAFCNNLQLYMLNDLQFSK